ncbi:FHA domain-containing protein [Streptomyces sp. CC228A]|uniref:FHA domain-containing protein n=1 Tax=Streptomyces sp. CC228A TaxID=2898186 RepID=UPI001F345986|nr:FHA domain-containing protein [Streptomyces sp. CC228A]
MPPRLVGQQGSLAGKQFPVGAAPVTLGRHSGNSVVIPGANVSRFHAEVRREGHGFVLYDRGSSNGTLVNGERVTSRELQPGDLVGIGGETFRFEAADPLETILDFSVLRPVTPSRATVAAGDVLKVTVSGGGPVGLGFALLLEHLMGHRVDITVYDGRWMRDGAEVVWKSEAQGNVRRRQVVTVQSRQYLNLPEQVQERLFRGDAYSEMWPVGPDSIRGFQPRNMRIAY